MLKKEARKVYKAQRLALDPLRKKEKDSKILQHLKSQSWKDINFLHTFLSIERMNEPETMGFIEWIWENKPNITVVTPKIDHIHMQHYAFSSESQILYNFWDIPEIKTGKSIPPKDIDLVLVPLLVCDQKGNRVGYGKGYYDRFLSECRSDTYKIGLSHFEPIAQIDDVEDTDIPLDACITPNGLRLF